jgi:hypothetical protein
MILGEKRVMENKMHVLIFYENSPKTFPNLRITEPRVIINAHSSFCEVPVIRMRF